MTRGRKPIVLLALCGALLSGCSSSSNKATGDREVEPIVLTLANWQRGEADVGEWRRAVERLSNGAIRIDVRGSWRLGEVETDSGTLEDVRAGRVDIGHIAARAWDTLGVDSLRALEAPLLVDSLELEERILTGDLGAEMLDGVRDAGVEPLALIAGPMMRPLGVSRDLLEASDYDGALFGLRPSAGHAEAVRAAGARVEDIRSAPKDLGALDATDIDVAAVETERYDGQARSMTADVVLWPRVTTLVMNRDTWDDLKEGQRNVLREAARAAMPDELKRERRLERGGLAALCERDFPFVRAGTGAIEELRNTLEPVYRTLEEEDGARATLAEIRSLKDNVSRTAELDCPGAPPVSTETSHSPVVGTWVFTATRAQLGAAGDRVTGENVDDNWGRYRFVLSKEGWFEMHIDRHPEGPIGLGTWEARGDELIFTPGGTLEQGAGETWRYRWTLFRDTLVLRRLSNDMGPTALTVAPMRRR
ncbi:MAG TPA: hypothetical protein VH683_09790 [Thermoleophilaceae bacterium]